EAAVAALDAQVGVPRGDQVGDVALLEGRGTAGIRAVHRKRADRKLVATALHHRRGDGADEVGRVCGYRRRPLAGRGDPLGHLDPVQRGQRVVDRGVVAGDHLGAPPGVRLADRRLDRGDGLVPGQYPGDGEETRL